MPIAPGETFERYDVEALIGQGGMGEVYRATDTKLRRKVALKVLRSGRGGPDAVARMFREARAAAALSHPNTVAIHDLGETDGTVYLVMEYISGKPLFAYVGDDRVTVARKVAWLVAIARALAAAHKAGVIHRDVKPTNVMITDEDVVKVLDFGLAKPQASGPVSFKTMAGHALGTPRYMPPEVLDGAEADARSDQYSFAVTAYELLGGSHPGPPGESVFPPLESIDGKIPSAVGAAIARALSAAPADRFATMEELADALDSGMRGSAAVPTAPTVTIREADGKPSGSEPVTLSPLAASVAVDKKPNPVNRTLMSRQAPDGIVPKEKDVIVKDAKNRTMPMLKAPAIVPPPAARSAPPPAATPAPSTPPPPRNDRGVMLAVVGAVGVFAIGGAAFAYIYASPRAEPPAAASSAAAVKAPTVPIAPEEPPEPPASATATVAPLRPAPAAHAPSASAAPTASESPPVPRPSAPSKAADKSLGF